MDKHIIEEGWNNWKNPANELTARYAEFNSTGPGGSAQKRVSWSKQLTSEQALAYSNDKILGAWRPSKKIN
jgi:pectinesterase